MTLILGSQESTLLIRLSYTQAFRDWSQRNHSFGQTTDVLGERQHCLYREGEAPAEPKPSSAGASLSHWNPCQVVFTLPLALYRLKLYGHRVVGGEVDPNIAAVVQIELPRFFPRKAKSQESIRTNKPNRTDYSPGDRSVFS